MKTIVFFCLIVSPFFFSSCSKDKIEENNDSLNCETPVSFDNEILPLIMSSCATAGCHNEASAASGYSFTSYESIQQNSAIMLKTMIKEPGVTPMPIGGELAPSSIDLFECWIEQGTKQTIQ